MVIRPALSGKRRGCQLVQKIYKIQHPIFVPVPAGVCVPPPPSFPGEGGHTRLRESGWVGPNSDEGTDTGGILGIYRVRGVLTPVFR
jgi:hypothetical protein